MNLNRQLILASEDITRRLDRMAYQIWENNAGAPLAVVGIHSRGVPLAKRLQTVLEKISGTSIAFGTLDIGLYRDDIGRIEAAPYLRDTQIDFDLDPYTIILVDDVLYTGRTVRAALNALIDIGRPKKVELLVLIDRGHRELPIQADYIGETVKTQPHETVKVLLQETDSEAGVFIVKDKLHDSETG